MTSSNHPIAETMETSARDAFLPLNSSSQEDQKERPRRISVCQLKHWKNELQYIQWENEQLLLLYQLHLNYKDHNAQEARRKLELLVTHTIPALQKELDQFQRMLTNDHPPTTRLSYIELQEKVVALKTNVNPLKSAILRAMVSTIPLSIK